MSRHTTRDTRVAYDNSTWHAINVRLHLACHKYKIHLYIYINYQSGILLALPVGPVRVNPGHASVEDVQLAFNVQVVLAEEVEDLAEG